MAATMRVSIQLNIYIFFLIPQAFEHCSRCGCVSLPALAWSKTCQEAYENAMKDMKWVGLCCLFVPQPGNRLCSVALLSSLQSLQCSLSGGNKRYWYTWTSIMGTIASLMPASLIYSSHISFLSSVFSLSSRSGPARGLGDGSPDGSSRLSQ